MTTICEPCMDEVMTPNPVAIDCEATLSEARQLMARLGVRHLPVTTCGVVEGIINERDIQLFSVPGHNYPPEDELHIKDISSTRIHVADVEDPLGAVLGVMLSNHLDAVVLLRDGEMAGIFTEADACRILAKQLGYKLK